MHPRLPDQTMQSENFLSAHILPDAFTSDQKLKNEILVAIENTLGSQIETDLENRARNLPTMDTAKLVAEYMQLSSVRKFLLRTKSKFSSIEETALNVILIEYLEAQISFAQSVTSERDVLTISQYIRQQFGLNESIRLLENIADENFDIEKFLDKNIQEQKLKREQQIKEAVPLLTPLISNNPALFQYILQIIHRLKNLYAYAKIKDMVYDTEELKKEKSYKNLQESLMWVDGQRHVCILGMTNVVRDNIPKLVIAANTPITATALHGARGHLQVTIGIAVDDELQILTDKLTTTSAEDILKILKSKKFYQDLLATLTNGSRGGFNSYLPQVSVTSLVLLIDEYLYISIHLAQSLMHEKSVIRISQNIRQDYGIEISKKLMIDIEKPDFDVETFFTKLNKRIPSQEIKTIIDNIHKFYVYADVKKKDCFFDAEDVQAKKLFESEMWVGLQRRCCIEGMSLIQSGEVYNAKTISLDNLDQAMEILPAEEKPDVTRPANKRQHIERTVASSHVVAMPDEKPDFYNWNRLQDVEMDDAEAVALAINLSLQPNTSSFVTNRINGVTSDEAALNEALRLSRQAPPQQPVQLTAPAARILEEKCDSYGDTELMNAASDGSIPRVRTALANGGNINTIGRYGNRAIHYAAKKNHLEVVAFLISAGASPTDPNYSSETAHSLMDAGGKFVAAASEGNILRLMDLINNFKVPANICNSYNETALMGAASEGQLAVVKLLVDTYQVDVKTRGLNWNQAIHLASKNGKYNVVQYLITQGASPTETNLSNETAHSLMDAGNKFVAAASDGNIQRMEDLITNFKVPAEICNSYNNTALMGAASEGQLAVVTLLVETYHVDVKVRGANWNQAIHLAAKNGKSIVVQYLITQGASPTETNLSSETAHSLMDAGGKFVAAAAEGNIARMRDLITNFKVPADICNPYNRTGLMAAASEGQLDAVIFLVETHHVDVKTRGANWNQAIHLAAKNGKYNVVKYLITKEASPTDTNQSGETAHSLMDAGNKFVAAAAAGEIDIMKDLIDNFKVTADIYNRQNQTALMIASKNGNSIVVSFLVETCQASLEAKAANSKRAIHFAQENNQQSIVTYLVSKGAEPIPDQNRVPDEKKSVTVVSGISLHSQSIQFSYDYSIFGDAIKMLEALKSMAKSVENEKDDIGQDLSDEKDEIYGRRHAMQYNRTPAGLSEKRFSAAGKLINSAISLFSEKERATNMLDITVRPGSDHFQISISYNHVKLSQKYRTFNPEKNLPAPASQLPFVAIEKIIKNIIINCFSDWVPETYDNTRLTQSFSDFEEYLTKSSPAMHVENVCKIIDATCDFDLKLFRNEQPLRASINKATHDRLKALIGYTLAQQYSEQSRLIISPVISHAQQQVAQPKAEKMDIEEILRIAGVSSSSPTEPARNNFSIIEDAKKLLDSMQSIASQVAHEKDDTRAPTYDTSTESDAKYWQKHKVEYSQLASGLTRERFYAAQDLIEMAFDSINKSRSEEDIIKHSINNGTAVIQIRSTYNYMILQQTGQTQENLPAPIAKFPFAAVKASISSILADIFSKWQPAEYDGSELMQIFAKTDSRCKVSSLLRIIEKTCKEVESNFELKTRLNSIEGSSVPNQVFVNKSQLEQAKQILGYTTVAALYSQSPSVARLLSASSPILNREQQVQQQQDDKECDPLHPNNFYCF